MSQYRIELGFDRNALATDFRSGEFYLPGDITRRSRENWVPSTHTFFNVGDTVSFRVFDITDSAAPLSESSMHLTAHFTPAHDLPVGSPTSPFESSDLESEGLDDLGSTLSVVFGHNRPAWDVRFKAGTELAIENLGRFVARYIFKRVPPGGRKPRIYVHDPEWIIEDDGKEDELSSQG